MKMRRRSLKERFPQESFSKHLLLLKSVFLGEKIGRTLLIGVILVILTFLVSPNLIVTPYPEEGEISPSLIKAPYDFSYEDKSLTKSEQKEAAEKVNPVYELELKLIPSILEEVKKSFEKIKKIKTDKTLDLEKTISKFREEFPGITISEENLKAILKYPEIYAIEEDITGLLKTWLTYGTTDIPEERLLPDVRRGIRLRILSPTGVSEKLVETTKDFFFLDNLPQKSPLYPKPQASLQVQMGVFELAKSYLQPNLKFSEKETKKVIKEAIKSVKPIILKVSKGEKIIGEGEKVDRTAAMKLAELSKQRSAAITVRTLGFILLIYVLMMLIFIYLYKYPSGVIIRNKNLGLIGLIIIITIALAKVILIANLSLYILPMGACAILLGVLLNERIAIFVSVILSILIGIIVGEKIEFIVLFTSGALAGIFTTSQARSRGDLIRGGLAVGITQGIIIIGYSLFRQEQFLQMQSNLLWGSVVNGFMTTTIAMGGLPYLERIFNITTNFTLFELADLNSPLLKNLLLKAPGTYHHSLLVGNIAEASAEAVGASPLLIRVASYYHDIGKMIRPEYFIENQTESERNKHETLRSTLSVSILRSHIKDGVEIAIRNRLPQSVIEIIQQHHGSSIMAYFYHQAKEKEARENVEFKESEFSYPGPKPQSKEAAIVMLADSVEAASRTLIKPTVTRLEKLVKKIIDDKFISGELDECNLTLKDLTNIAQSFTRILITLFHARVEYPEREKEQEKAVLLNVENINNQTSSQQENQYQPA